MTFVMRVVRDFFRNCADQELQGTTNTGCRSFRVWSLGVISRSLLIGKGKDQRITMAVGGSGIKADNNQSSWSQASRFTKSQYIFSKLAVFGSKVHEHMYKPLQSISSQKLHTTVQECTEWNYFQGPELVELFDV